MYVDGFVLAIDRNRVDEYREMARKSASVWKEHGALGYVECIEDDVQDGEVTDFRTAVKAGKDKVIGFAWATYPSREARDATVAKVMADPRMQNDMTDPPFDMKTMIFGGFKPIVEA
jgi:uncharacterized protein YbaA (DUF1428 family)